MVRKHLHHFSRGLVIGFEVLGLGVLVLVGLWLALIIRLSQGPLNVDFLTKNIEKSFNKQQAEFKISVGGTVLTWGKPGQHFIFEMRHVQVARADNTPVLSIEKIGVQLSKKHLIFGEFVPRIIRIYEPALRIVHDENGHFTLNVNDTEAATEAPASPAPSTAPAGASPDKKTSQMEFIKGLLGQMKEGGRGSLLGGLDEVSISDAALLYEDKTLNVQWKSDKSTIVLERVTGGIAADALINIEQSPTHIATVRSNLRYDWQTRNTNGTVVFTNFNPALMAQQSETLKALAGADLALKGTVSLNLDADFNPGYGRFVLGADPGKFSAPGLYAEPIPVKALYMQGKFNVPTGEMALEQLHADVGGPKIIASGSILQHTAGHIVTVSATLQDMPLDKLKAYWPASLTPDPRAWVTGHLSTGIATKATLELALLSPHACAATCASPWSDFGTPQVQKVGGQIDFNNIKVDYFPPLLPVTKVKGRATYDQKSFNLDLTGGELGDMAVTGSKIAITGLDVQSDTVHSRIDIDVSLKGPLRTALKVLDSPPLQYPKKLGLQTADVAGDAKVDVNFKFPLYAKLALNDVKVTAKAQLDNVLLKGVLSGMALSGGPMALSLNDGSLNVKGSGRLNAMPISFDWLKNFSSKAPVAARVEASLPLDAAALTAFGVPDTLKVTGTIPAKMTYTVGSDGKALLVFKGDITPAGFSLPIGGYEKKPQTTGTLDMSLLLKGDQISKITGIDLETDKARIKGDMNFLSDGKTLKSASFGRVKLGDTDIALTITSRGSEGYDVKAMGAQFDASSFFSDSNTPNSDADAAIKTTPISLSMDVDRLVTGKDKSIDKLHLFMRRNMWSRIDQLSVDGISGGQPVTLRYTPGPQGHTLSFEADNAGAALRAMGIANGVRGGKVIVNGLPDAQDPGRRNMHGTAIMTDFTLVNAPVLGKLLNALSLNGFMELLNGKGIAFKKMRCDFWWTDKGQPVTAKNVRLLTIRDGQTSGASLGLTFEGSIDNWRNTLDLNGTIIPVSDVNKLLAVIPLVGDILTGGGKGVFAATYTIRGPKDRPDVSVNPLSVLAPGILRKIFFEK